MYSNNPQPVSPQPQLFLLEESIGNIELFPAVWSALEDLTNQDTELRRDALERLVDLEAPRFSPIVSYILVTRIIERNLDLRAGIIETLGEVLSPDINGALAPEDVRSSLYLYLSGFRTRQIFALLQVSAEYKSLEDQVARLLNACPYAGNHLIDILKDHKMPIEVRKQAAIMIGLVGYLYTLPAMERLAGRLEARLSGQEVMPFAPQSNSSESELLPIIQDTIRLLQAP